MTVVLVQASSGGYTMGEVGLIMHNAVDMIYVSFWLYKVERGARLE